MNQIETMKVLVKAVVILSSIGLLSVPVVWIWIGWDLAWRVLATSCVALGVSGIVFVMAVSALESVVNKIKDAEKLSTTRKSFRDRIQEEMEKKSN